MTDTTHPFDRYQAVGLRHNPFSAPQLHGAQDIDTASVFVDRGLAGPPPPGSGTLVQVIGDSGFGKSTQLQEWRRHTPGPYHYVARTPYKLRWTPPPLANGFDVATTTMYGDEIDRMPAPLRWRWFRSLAQKNATLVIGTHIDLASKGERAGFTVESHWLGPVGHDVMASMIDRRLQAATLNGHTSATVTAADFDIDFILAESNGVPGEADVVCHRLLAERVI